MTDDTLQTRIRSGEEAYVSVDGEPCWTRKGMTAEQGTSQCGRHTNDHPGAERKFSAAKRLPVARTINRDWDDDSVPVVGCIKRLKGGGDQQVKVRVWTNLDQGPEDESFGIDNVLVQEICDGIPWPVGKINDYSMHAYKLCEPALMYSRVLFSFYFICVNVAHTPLDTFLL